MWGWGGCLEAGAGGEDAAEEDEEEVGVDVALVDLVDKDVRHAVQQAVVLRAASRSFCY